MLLRAEHRVSDLVDIMQAALGAGRAPFRLYCNNRDAILLHERISLSASSRKLLWPYLDRAGQVIGTGGRLRLSRDHESQQLSAAEQASFHMRNIGYMYYV